MRQVVLENGYKAWNFGSAQFVVVAVINLKNIFPRKGTHFQLEIQPHCQTPIDYKLTSQKSLNLTKPCITNIDWDHTLDFGTRSRGYLCGSVNNGITPGINQERPP